MMRLAVSLCIVLLLNGCSLLGDRFRNRSLDYLSTEQSPPLRSEDGRPLAAAELYPIPEFPAEYQRPKSFSVPKPAPLEVEAETTENTSLLQFQANRLNPKLDHDGAGSLVLQLEGNYTGLWAAVTDAIAASSLKLSDLNRNTGTWYLAIEHTVQAKDRGWWARLWGQDKTVTEIYQLKLHRTRLGGYVSLLKDAETLAGVELNEQVLNEILQKLEQ